MVFSTAISNLEGLIIENAKCIRGEVFKIFIGSSISNFNFNVFFEIEIISELYEFPLPSKISTLSPIFILKTDVIL